VVRAGRHLGPQLQEEVLGLLVPPPSVHSVLTSATALRWQQAPPLHTQALAPSRSLFLTTLLGRKALPHWQPRCPLQVLTPAPALPGSPSRPPRAQSARSRRHRRGRAVYRPRAASEGCGARRRRPPGGLPGAPRAWGENPCRPSREKTRVTRSRLHTATQRPSGLHSMAVTRSCPAATRGVQAQGRSRCGPPPGCATPAGGAPPRGEEGPVRRRPGPRRGP